MSWCMLVTFHTLLWVRYLHSFVCCKHLNTILHQVPHIFPLHLSCKLVYAHSFVCISNKHIFIQNKTSGIAHINTLYSNSTVLLIYVWVLMSCLNICFLYVFVLSFGGTCNILDSVFHWLLNRMYLLGCLYLLWDCIFLVFAAGYFNCMALGGVLWPHELGWLTVLVISTPWFLCTFLYESFVAFLKHLVDWQFLSLHKLEFGFVTGFLKISWFKLVLCSCIFTLLLFEQFLFFDTFL